MLLVPRMSKRARARQKRDREGRLNQSPLQKIDAVRSGKEESSAVPGPLHPLRDTVPIVVLILISGSCLLVGSDWFTTIVPLAGLHSQFAGPVDRLSDGSMVIRGIDKCCSIAATRVNLERDTEYRIVIEAQGQPELHVDFFEPGYDSFEQEVVVGTDLRGDRKVLWINSGNCPHVASLRIFFNDSRDVTIRYFSLDAVTHRGLWLWKLLVALTALLLLGYLCRYRAIFLRNRPLASWVRAHILQPTRPTLLRDTAILAAVVVLSGGLYYLLRLPVFTSVSTIATQESGFRGPVKRGGDGSLTILGTADGVSIAWIPIQLNKAAAYRVTVQAEGTPEFHIDFFGPNYDSNERELVWLEGPKTGKRSQTMTPGNPPPGVALRLYFKGAESIHVKSLRLEEVTYRFGWLTALLLLLNGILLLLFALRSGSHIAVRGICLTLLVGWVYFHVSVPSNMNTGDNFWYVPTARSILHDGNLDVSEAQGLVHRLDRDARLLRIDDGYYSIFPFGTSVLCAPLLAAGDVLFTEPQFEPARNLFLSALIAKILALVCVFLFYLVASKLTGKVLTVVLTLTFAFCTSHFSAHAGGLWSHNAADVLLLAALALLLSQSSPLAGLSGGCLIFAYFVRPDVSIAVVVLTVYVVLFRRRSLVVYCCSLAGVAIVLLALSYMNYHTVIPPYYSTTRLGLSQFREALIGNLFSPNRGLFWFTPIAAFSTFGAWLAFRSRQPLFVCLSVIASAHWIVISAFPHWWGGWGFGPRLFSVMNPLLVLLLIPALEQISQVRPLVKISLVVLLCAAGVWSLFVQVRGATDEETFIWNGTPSIDDHPERIWDWRDWQPARGLRR